MKILFLAAPPEPIFTLSWIAVLGLAVLAYGLRRTGGFPLRRALGLAFLRASVFLLLLLFLFHPVRRREIPVDVPRRLVVLLDASASMSLPGPDGRPRHLPMHETLAPFLANLPPSIEPILLSFDGSVRSIRSLEDHHPEGSGTDLAGAISAAGALLRGPSEDRDPRRKIGGGILLVSDGVRTRGEDPLAAADGLGAKLPIFSLVPEAGEAGPRILSMQTPSILARGREIEVRTEIGGRAPLALRLYESDGSGSERIVATSENLAPGSAVLAARATGPDGIRSFRLEITGSGPDAAPEDNERKFDVRILPPAGILLLSGRLSWEYRDLRAAVETLPELEANLVAFDGPRGVYTGGPSSPPFARPAGAGSSDFSPFATVVLLDVGPEALGPGASARLAEEVGAGRIGLLSAGGGVAATSLASVLPARPRPLSNGGTVSPDPSAAGHPVLETLPPLAGAEASIAFDLSPAARALARYADGSPAIVEGRSGIGRVLLVGPEVWRARARGADSSAIVNFWQAAIRRIAPGTARALRLTAPPRAVTPGTEIRLRIEGDSGASRIRRRITGPGLDREEAAPLADPVRFVPEREGDYAVEIAPEEDPAARTRIRIAVRARAEEYSGPNRDTQVLSALAERTGGRILAPGELRAAADAVAGRVLLTRTETRDLVSEPGWLLLLAGLFATEWFLRRRWGLR